MYVLSSFIHLHVILNLYLFNYSVGRKIYSIYFLKNPGGNKPKETFIKISFDVPLP